MFSLFQTATSSHKQLPPIRPIHSQTFLRFISTSSAFVSVLTGCKKPVYLLYLLTASECHDDFHYGPNCAQPCACVINNTRSCDHVNGTCFCKEPWEGVTCDTDTDECAKDPGICGDPFTRCVNTDGGYKCVCSDTAVYDAASGDCIGKRCRVLE